MDIQKEQLSLVRKANKYIINTEKKGINVGTSHFCYLACHHKNPGNAKLKVFENGISSIYYLCFITLKYIFAISTCSNYQIINNNFSKKKYSQLVISWSKKSDFRENGSYLDSYFNVNSRNTPKTMWFLIASDNFAPRNIDKNIKILKKRKSIFKYNLIFLTKKILKTIIINKFSINKILHNLSIYNEFANLMVKTIIRELKEKDFQTIVMPYEGYPFQQAICLAAKNFNSKIKTIGYHHCTLPPIPTDLIYRIGCPDKLLIHSSYELPTLNRFLKWPLKKLLLIPSLRYKNNNNFYFGGYIFLPYAILSEKILITEFEKFLTQLAPHSIKPLKIKNHPHMMKSESHVKIINVFKKIIKKYKNKFSKKNTSKEVSVFIGGTSAIFEAMDQKVNIIQICSDPVLESYNELFFPSLIVKKISDHIYYYYPRSTKKYIKKSNNKNIFKKYCLN